MLQRQLPIKITFKALDKFLKPTSCSFQENYFNRELPVRFQTGYFKPHIPAIQKWFLHLSKKKATCQLDERYFQPHSQIYVPIERTVRPGINAVPSAQDDRQSSRPDPINEFTFERLTAPLSVFLQWTQMKLSDPTIFDPHTSLYLAQCDLRELPLPLQLDLPTPIEILEAGKGDIYASSIWMGIPPTDTPLHRDPNPNLFIQLAGQKIVRLLRPDAGRLVYEYTKRLCAEAEGHYASNGATMRGDEMMMGLERRVLGACIWDNNKSMSQGPLNETLEIEGFETTLRAGDGVFIPKGWWHSIRGIGDHHNGINASVNWWFR